MILSASRRTDIPAYYSEWFFRRVAQGYICTRNPVHPQAVRRLSLRPEDVDGIVFWSKSPAPMLCRLQELNRYRFYFQFTLTPYGGDIEPGLPAKAVLADTFRRLSDALGPERVTWRYDPILLNPTYTEERHVDLFGGLATALAGYTRRCTVSFVDKYRNTAANAEQLALREMGPEVKDRMSARFARIGAEHGMELSACAEEEISSPLIAQAKCVDAGLFNALWGMGLPVRKDRNQRPACGCTVSVDIGAYNTCPGGCLYCYANYNPAVIGKNTQKHDVDGEFLINV
jgi:hypothetical protein